MTLGAGLPTLSLLSLPADVLPFLVFQGQGGAFPNNPYSPTEYQAWGILGVLAFAIFVLCAVLWRLFNRQTQAFESRDKVLMDFVDRHRSENTASLERMASTLITSLEKHGSVLDHSMTKLEEAFNRQQRRLDEVLLISKVLEKVAAMKKRGEALDETTIERITSSVISQSRNQQSGE